MDNFKKIAWLIGLMGFLLTSCSSSDQKILKVAATPVPHAEILKQAIPEMKKRGYTLKIVITEDYNLPNRALAQGEVDANFFQHEAFLKEQIEAFGYPVKSIAKIELEPMGAYSEKIQKINDLKTGDQVAIPNDPSNEGRALLLLEKEGLIQLNKSKGTSVTIRDILSNPKQLNFIEVDAAILPRTLEDVTLAVINTNFALEAGMNPLTDALALEDKDSPYANVLVVREEDSKRVDIQTLKDILTSEEMRKFIEEKYQGAILPAF